MNGFRRMVSFACCVPSTSQQKCRRIDRYAIGVPTDFRHVCHMGRELADLNSNGNTEISMTDQMKSKCGNMDSSIQLTMKVIDLKDHVDGCTSSDLDLNKDHINNPTTEVIGGSGDHASPAENSPGHARFSPAYPRLPADNS